MWGVIAAGAIVWFFVVTPLLAAFVGRALAVAEERDLRLRGVSPVPGIEPALRTAASQPLPALL